jgi:hypothetical protein
VEKFKVGISLAREHGLFLAERYCSGALETDPLLVKFLGRTLVPAVERDA